MKNNRNWFDMAYSTIDRITDLGKLNRDDAEALTVKKLQTSIGIMGCLLAFWLTFGNVVFGCSRYFQPSISDYYYTNMRDFFVGTLFAVAVFLFCYRGYNKWDDSMSTAAGVFAFLTAIVPTNMIPGYGEISFSLIFYNFTFREAFHFTFAALFLIIISFMSIFLFTKTNEKGDSINKKVKKVKNKIHFTCGFGILTSLLLIAFCLLLEKFSDLRVPFHYVYTFEVFSLMFFSTSWFTKAKRFDGIIAKILTSDV